MRILFLGTPEFAVPSLEKLLAWPDVSVVGLVTQPDRPAGRGKKIVSPPTKIVAQSHNITVLQPEKLSKAPEVVQAMRDLCPDLLVTVAFGQILKKNVLTMAANGVMNVHGSLLPKYRGAAPINWAIINGESISGITTMFSDEGIDTGKMLLKKSIEITENMDAESLARELSILGAELLKETIARLMKGELEAQVQDETGASYAPRLTKEMGNIDWTKPAKSIHNLVRGLYPWPGTYTHYDGQVLKVLKSKPISANQAHKAGQIISLSPNFIVACGEDGKEALEILEVKPANKGAMSPSSWANGLHLKPGAELRMQ